MTMTVRKTDEELTDKRICKIGGLMTDWGLIEPYGHPKGLRMNQKTP